MLRYDLNISITMRDLPWPERIERAARLGFAAIEFWWPGDLDYRQLTRQIRDSGLQVALFNLDGGNLAAGQRGLLNQPEAEAQIRANLMQALELAQTLGCTRLNALVGNRLAGVEQYEQLALIQQRLTWMCQQAATAGVTLLVEALNRWETPDYLICTTREALALIEQVGASNLAYQYDIYHMQRMEGNILATLEQQISRIGHIQIADSPGRHQPGTGELAFPRILSQIKTSPYPGWVGLEYLPLGRLEESLGWMD